VAELSEMSGVSKPYILQIEDGRRKNPSGEILRKLASALGTTVADLMGAPVGISEADLEQVPRSLRYLARKKGKQLDLRKEDLEMLKLIHYRGKRISRPEDWELLFLFIRRILD
jgi:transcriptional regulator with XRE-family HTH domain